MESGSQPEEPEDDKGHKHKRQRTDVAATAEAASGEDGCSKCAAEVRALKHQLEAFQHKMEAKMHTYVQTYVATILSSRKAQDSADELQLVSVAPPDGHPATSCFICDGPGKAVVSPQLGVCLDARCRKQLAVLQRGSKTAVRYEMWQRALPLIQTKQARELCETLKLPPADPKLVASVAPYSGPPGELCAVCQEPFKTGSRVQTLQCDAHHLFHHECVSAWFEESASCPVCRKDFSTQCGGPGRLQQTLSVKSGIEKGQADNTDDEIDADLLALLSDVSGPGSAVLAGCCDDSPGAPSSQLRRMPSLLESWELEPLVQAQLLEDIEPLAQAPLLETVLTQVPEPAV